MALSNQKKVQHLYSRAGFGADYATFSSMLSAGEQVDLLFDKSRSFSPIVVVDKSLLPRKEVKDLPKLKQLGLLAEAVRYGKELNVSWIRQMSDTDAVLREKMCFFWHGHFACRTLNPVFAQDLNNIQRQHALGNFKELLTAVSKSPAMLEFLNNKQNRKQHPNENFARELMELFTIGRGHYTEQDIRESARAFTGWSFDVQGNFELKSTHHDEGDKLFMGQRGNLGGEDIIEILLSQKQTAHFICSKLYRFFVNDEVDELQVTKLAELFYSSGYDIRRVMIEIFKSDWFYSEKNIGAKIKSPVELLIGMNRSFGIKYDDPKTLFYIQKVLGQILFLPPNVSGWAGGKNWIDSSSLMFRLKLASLLLDGGLIEVEEKDDMPEEYKLMMVREKQAQAKVERKVKAQPNWEKFSSVLPQGISKKELGEYVLSVLPPRLNLDQIMEPGTDHLRSVVIELLSSPEYQMC
jgi:uncharacterized protein (DUF1800 family)